MYVRSDVVAMMHAERLDEAQRRRTAWQMRAIRRAQRKAARAEQRMGRARREASRLRLQLDAES